MSVRRQHWLWLAAFSSACGVAEVPMDSGSDAGMHAGQDAGPSGPDADLPAPDADLPRQDAGGCSAEAERCDGVDQDCDGRIDEEDGVPLCPGTVDRAGQCSAGACALRGWGWTRFWASAGPDDAFNVATDAADNSFVGGSMSEDFDFGAGVRAIGANSAVLVSYDALGALRWARSWGISGVNRTVDAVPLDDGTLLVLVVSTRPNSAPTTAVDFGGGVRTISSQSCFLVHLDAHGDYLDDHRVSEGRFSCREMAVSPSTVAIGGFLWDFGADLGGGHHATSHGVQGAVVALDRGTYAFRWEDVHDAHGFVESLAFTESGDLLVAGAFDDALDLGLGVELADAEAGFVAAYASDGAPRWVHVFDRPADERFAQVVRQHGQTLAVVQVPMPPTVSYVVAIDDGGAERWRTELRAHSARVGVAEDGSIAVAGSLHGEYDLGRGPETVPRWAGFLLHLSPSGRPIGDQRLSSTTTNAGVEGLARIGAGWIVVGPVGGELDLGQKTVAPPSPGGVHEAFIALAEDVPAP